MKIGVIAAAGNLGGRVVTECLERGHTVTAFVNRTPCREARAKSVKKSLFDLTREDITGLEVLICAYGSGFEVNPEINRRALNQLAELTAGTPVRFLTIVGSGCLYQDDTHTLHCWENPEYPPFLKGISMNTTLGTEDVMARKDVQYTFCCPGQCFDGENGKTGSYLTDTTMAVARNEDGSSYTTYGDMAEAMVDFAEQSAFIRSFVTVLSRRGRPAWEEAK